MPGGGGDPAAQSIAIQMEQSLPGRCRKPGAFVRHVAGLAQSLALPHRDYCTGLQAISVVLRGLAHAVASLMRCTLSVLSRLVFINRPTCAFSGPPLPPTPPEIKMPISPRKPREPGSVKGVHFDEGFRADLIVEGKVILELKSVEALTNAHKKQVLTYLRLTGMKLGFLLNFGAGLMKDGITRVANDLAED